MRKTRRLEEFCAQVSSRAASSSLERWRPSTHRATTLELAGSLERMAAASRARAASICA